MSVRHYPTGMAIEYFLDIRDRATNALVTPSGAVTLTLTGAGLSSPLVLTRGVDSELVTEATGQFRVVRASAVGGKLKWKWATTGDYVVSAQGYDLIETGD